MAKRFTDTELWKHDWFLALTPLQKCLWRLICDECDAVGVWPMSLKLAGFQLGESVSFKDIEALGIGSRVILISDDKIWIPGFIKFQYKTLNPKNSAHRGMMRSIVNSVGHLPLEGESRELVESFIRHLSETQSTLDRGSSDPTGKGKGLGKGKVKKGGVGENNFFDFQALYAKYPRKEGKAAGIKACRKQIQTQEAYDSLSLAIDRYSAHCARENREQKHIQHFSTFLGSDRTVHPWRDWLDPETGTASKLAGEEPDWVKQARADEAAARERKNAV